MSTNENHALGIVETNSVPRGILVTDEMIKRAHIDVVESCPMCPGKYLSMIRGPVGDVRQSVEHGVDVAGAFFVDSVVIPDIHPDVLPAMARTSSFSAIEALGIIETHAMASAVEVADRIAKHAQVYLLELRLSRCLGGKSFVAFTGDVGAVRAAGEEGEGLARERGQLVHSVVIARPHHQLHGFLV